MKPIDNRKIRSLVMATALSIGLGFVTHASAQTQKHSYLIDLKAETATDLGDVAAIAMNDAGQVVGYSNATGHAFITGLNGAGMKDLGSLSPTAVNNAGQVTGSTDRGFSFITDPNGVGMRELSTLSEYNSHASGINNAGQVVGYDCCFFGMSGGKAFITGPNGEGVTNVPDRGGESYAYGINDAGQVVGAVRTGEFDFSAFITGPNGVDITVFDTWNGFSLGINNAGRVAGELDTRGAFITGPNGVGVTDLGRGFRNVNDINDAGQVAGNSGSHALITGPNGVGVTDLNSLVHLPDGGVMTNALAINNMGQVLVSTVSTVPEPESYALMLAGLVLTGVMVRRKQKADSGRDLSLVT